MDEDPFEAAGREFKRAIEEHSRRLREEMERARKHMNEAVIKARTDMERARVEFDRMMAEAKRQRWRPVDPTNPDDWMPPSKRRRPPRKPRGGELAPVKPKPKPKPLVDGAEAPIE